MSIVQQVRRVNTDIEVRRKSAEFVQLARCLLLAKSQRADGLGGPGTALKIAEANRAPESVKNILSKAAVAAGTLTNSTWASSLADYRVIANGFLESLRHQSAFQEILSAGAFRQIPLRTKIGAVTT